MRGAAFVSFSAEDKATVEALTQSAPKGLFTLYTHDFRDGAKLLSEMERHVRGCSLFLFLASKASLASAWCQHEISLAQIETITRGLKVIALTIDPGVQVTDLPSWMRVFWMPATSDRMPVLRRRFIDILEENCAHPQYSGLHTRLDRIRQQYYQRISETHTAPNVFFFSGVEGVGRQTTARAFIQDIHQNRGYSNGPVITLEDPASIEDLYLRLYENGLGGLGDLYESELLLFRGMTVEVQIQRLIEVCDTVGRGGETIFIRSRSGLFDDNRDLIAWAKSFLAQCGTHLQIRLVIVSNRLPRYRDIADVTSLIHFHIDPLPQVDIDALVQAITLLRDGNSITPSPQARNSIGGHPILARHYAYALSQYGESAEERAMFDTILVQKNMLSEFLSFENINSDERDILAILSWVPHIQPKLFGEICAVVGLTDYAESIENLILASLIEYQVGYYAISGPVRLVFRQMYGDGDKEIGIKVAELLATKLRDSDLVTSEIVDTVSFLLLVGGKDLPPNVRRVISPSSILKAARSLYQQSRDQPGQAEYGRVAELAQAGLQIARERAVRLDLMAVRARAFLRLRLWTDADAIIGEIEAAGGRQALPIRAQYYRFRAEYRKAAQTYATVLQSGVTDDSIIHEYCICLRKLGEYEEVRKTIDRFGRNVARNPYLLGTKASLEMGAGEFRRAEKTIRQLATLPHNRETAAEKEAILISRETQNYPRALTIINGAIDRVQRADKKVEPDLHSTRCLIYCKLGLVQEAMMDMNLVRSAHPDGDFVAERLAIHILLGQSKPKEALAQFERMANKTRIDDLLKREILQSLLHDKSLSLSEKAEVEEKYNESITRKPLFTEFDF
ncbi:MAG TPA: toll/interleukin-1 receptor domain-containing protein [Acetobacteraceae bacterium]|nr:toll/interleukin-1 receptor domain-containing protein [Acetobacteraceae bacterium]